MNHNTFYASLPLDRSRRDIRLLEVIEIFPQFQGRLTVASLKDTPDFCALSYAWGDPSARQDIVVNDLPVSVTKNLADALDYVGPHYLQTCQDSDHATLRL